MFFLPFPYYLQLCRGYTETCSRTTQKWTFIYKTKSTPLPNSSNLCTKKKRKKKKKQRVQTKRGHLIRQHHRNSGCRLWRWRCVSLAMPGFTEAEILNLTYYPGASWLLSHQKLSNMRKHSQILVLPRWQQAPKLSFPFQLDVFLKRFSVSNPERHGPRQRLSRECPEGMQTNYILTELEVRIVQWWPTKGRNVDEKWLGRGMLLRQLVQV